MTMAAHPEGAPAIARYDYEVFGLRIASEILLPELLAAPDGHQWDVTIRMGRLGNIEGEKLNSLAVTAAGAVLNIPKAGRYFIRGGSEIIVEADPAGTERQMRLFLLGSALGAILHQRNLLPLHANSIEIAGRAVAFVGHSGAGKSTMAAWFHDRGFNVLADDVCVVTTEAKRPIAQPGIPRLRMWRDALEASGRSVDGYELSFDDAEKYNVPTRVGEANGPRELGAIYLLRKQDEEARLPLVQPLNGVDAIDALVANTYRGGYVPMMGATRQHLASCIALARAVPIFAVNRRWGKDYLEWQFRDVEEHAKAVLQD
jgi:hypothetical protein